MIFKKVFQPEQMDFVYGIVIVIAISMLLHSKKSQKKVENIE